MKGYNYHIPIHNVYYMLTYAFQTFNFTSLEDKFGKESFDNIYDFFAELLQMGIAFQLKQGLHKEYVPISESIITLKGKLDLIKTINNNINRKQLLHCEHDEWSENNLHNQILKATILSLLQISDIETQRKNKLRKLLPFFSNVCKIQASHINWKQIHYKKSSGLYPMLHFICSLILEHNLLSTKSTKYKGDVFWDDERMMSVLYEKFLLGYFNKHHSHLFPKSEEIFWAIDRFNTSNNIVPKMQSDIVLHGHTRTLIIDAKYYSKTLTENYNKRSIHTNNLYQISSYVMNMDKEHLGNVDGMLLYAQTDDESMVLDDKMTYTDGNVIYFKTLDLNQDFSRIRFQLNSIAELLNN